MKFQSYKTVLEIIKRRQNRVLNFNHKLMFLKSKGMKER